MNELRGDAVTEPRKREPGGALLISPRLHAIDADQLMVTGRYRVSRIKTYTSGGQ